MRRFLGALIGGLALLAPAAFLVLHAMPKQPREVPPLVSYIGTVDALDAQGLPMPEACARVIGGPRLGQVICRPEGGAK